MSDNRLFDIPKCKVTYVKSLHISALYAPRTRLHLTRTEARELKNQLATVLKGDHHDR